MIIKHKGTNIYLIIKNVFLNSYATKKERLIFEVEIPLLKYVNNF
jgi:hypothetical protein